MNSHDRAPSRDELLAMAYADGELDEGAARDLERRMADEPELVLEVAKHRRLEIIARRIVPPEPMDHEWERLRRGIVHGKGIPLGFALLLAGVLGLAGWIAFGLFTSDEPLGLKLLVGAIGGGLTILFLVTLRGRLRMRAHDPYTEVQR